VLSVVLEKGPICSGLGLWLVLKGAVKSSSCFGICLFLSSNDTAYCILPRYIAQVVWWSTGLFFVAGKITISY